MFVDYAGQTMPVVDRATGEVQEAQIFVGVLGASNFTFAEATESQSLADWTGSHVRMFEYFGGVPQVAVPDNLGSGVSRACRYEPDLNPTYQELAAHYGIAVWMTSASPPSANPSAVTCWRSSSTGTTPSATPGRRHPGPPGPPPRRNHAASVASLRSRATCPGIGGPLPPERVGHFVGIRNQAASSRPSRSPTS